MQNSNRSDSEYQQLKLTDDVGGPGGEGNYGVAPPLDQGDPHLREASDVCKSFLYVCGCFLKSYF